VHVSAPRRYRACREENALSLRERELAQFAPRLGLDLADALTGDTGQGAVLFFEVPDLSAVMDAIGKARIVHSETNNSTGLLWRNGVLSDRKSFLSGGLAVLQSKASVPSRKYAHIVVALWRRSNPPSPSRQKGVGWRWRTARSDRSSLRVLLRCGKFRGGWLAE
jgi:hypothetical protein